MSIYTLSKVEADILPKTMGSVDVLENPDILEVVKWEGLREPLRKRYQDAVFITQWRVKCGILYQEVAWRIS